MESVLSYNLKRYASKISPPDNDWQKKINGDKREADSYIAAVY